MTAIAQTAIVWSDVGEHIYAIIQNQEWTRTGCVTRHFVCWLTIAVVTVFALLMLPTDIR